MIPTAHRIVIARAAMTLALLLAAVPTAEAAITFVADLGGSEAAGGSNMLTITTTATAPAGASIIIGSVARGSEGNPTSVSCSDSGGNVYTTDLTNTSVDFAAICATHRIAAQLLTGSTLTITWSGGGSPFTKRARAFAVTGLASTPLDRTASASGISTSPSSGSGGTTGQADELLVGLISDGTANVAGAGFSPGSNGTTNNCATGTPMYTALPGGVGTTPPSLFLMYCIVASTGDYQANATTSSTWQALLTTLKAALPPTIAKAFGAATINVGATTTLTFTLTNPNAGTTLTGVGFNDTLPAGLVVATPISVTGSCVGAIAASNTISLTGNVLVGGGSCNLTVNVTATSAGLKTNITSNVTSNEAGPGNQATAAITVQAPPTIAKTFGAATINVGATTTLTFTLMNPNAGTTLTGVGFTDPLPAGLVVATPNGLSGPCDAGTITATPGGNTISLATATLTAGASCTFSVNVTATGAGAKTNTTSSVTSNEAGPGNQATANITVLTPPTIGKTFGAATINVGATTTLTFTLMNPNAGTTLTGVGFTDPLPAGLVVATPNGLTGPCDAGTITATPGGNTISLATATLAAGASCTFTVNVTAIAGATGTQLNTTSAVTSVQAGPGNVATATIAVAGAPAPIPALSPLGQALIVLVVVLTGLRFLRRRFAASR
jgi:fimbrial isopeptide formation D2 family protein